MVIFPQSGNSIIIYELDQPKENGIITVVTLLRFICNKYLGGKTMMEKIQRFGGAMITPVLLFAFNGIMLSFAILLKNEDIVGSIASDGTMWTNMWTVVENAGWVVFNHMEILFVLGLPIGLAKKATGRAALASFVIYMFWNTNINTILNVWDFGIDLSTVGETIGIKEIAGVATLDTNLIGALAVAGITIWLHNRFYDTTLPEWLGVFSGTSFVVILGFILMIPFAFLTVWIWPVVQQYIYQLQDFMAQTGTFGVGIYVFLERILIPTGLHHFIWQPFELGPAIVEGGVLNSWLENLSEIAAYSGSLREIFPQGGFGFHNYSKVFAPIGIGLAFIATSKPEKRKVTAALVIPTALTAILAGITEPFEFTFLFLAPQLFFVHALLAAGMSMTLYALGVAGNIGGGLISNLSYFLIPMAKNHLNAVILFFVVGLAFSAIYFFVFRFAILKWDIKTPGREDDLKVKMYSKDDYKQKSSKENPNKEKAAHFLEGLGGPENILEVNNCVSRLRLKVKDEDLVKEDAYFKAGGAHGVVRKDKAIQVIVGLEVPKVRDFFDELRQK